MIYTCMHHIQINVVLFPKTGSTVVCGENTRNRWNLDFYKHIQVLFHFLFEKQDPRHRDKTWYIVDISPGSCWVISPLISSFLSKDSTKSEEKWHKSVNGKVTKFMTHMQKLQPHTAAFTYITQQSSTTGYHVITYLACCPNRQLPKINLSSWDFLHIIHYTSKYAVYHHWENLHPAGL